MTRQRFEGLRREAVRRLLVKYDTKHENKLGKALNMDRVDWSKAQSKSYAEVWESMRPLRDLVGM